MDAELAAAGAPDNDPRPHRHRPRHGRAHDPRATAPTSRSSASCGPLWAGEEVWCQLFSEPGAGSDLAALGDPRGTRRRRETGSSTARRSGRPAPIWPAGRSSSPAPTRTCPSTAASRYFVCDMTDPGVEVRPLRQITGEAEFNEVFLTDVRIPDAHRLGEVGEGWKVAQTTLMNERVAIGGARIPREGGMIGVGRRRLARTPRTAHPRSAPAAAEAVGGGRGRPADRRAAAPAARRGPAGTRGQRHEAGLRPPRPGDQRLEVEFLAEDGLTYDDWTMRRPDGVDFTGREAGYRYLRAKGNSIEGGTSRSAAQHRRRTRAGAAARAAHRQGRRVEGPPPMNDGPPDRHPGSRPRPAVLRGRGRAARRRTVAARRPRRSGHRARRPGVGRAYDTGLWQRARHGDRRGGAAGAREARRRRARRTARPPWCWRSWAAPSRPSPT